MNARLKSLVLFVVLLITATASAWAVEIPGESKITAVTLYRSMARETRTSTVHLPAGNSEVVLSGVSLEMLDPSIQVSVKGIGTLLSASVRTNHFRDPLNLENNPKAMALQDSIKRLGLQLRWITEERGVHTGEVELVNNLLKSAADKKEYKPAELEAVASIYRSRIMELRKKLFDLQLLQESLDTRLRQHNAQLAELAPKPKAPVKEIVLNFWSDEAAAVQLQCRYLVGGAGWVPMYDLNVVNTSRPVDLSYKAGISQRTGFEWKNVNLTLSTSTPGMNNDRPIMNPEYIDYVTYSLTLRNEGILNSYMAFPSQSADTVALNLPSVTKTTETQEEYVIERLQSIPSDGKQHICQVKEFSIPATYRYHAVPKLEQAAFLIARITDYGQYNLLPGQANIFFEETYVGQVELNPEVTSDTLLVSLGRDERIVVKRARVNEKTSKKVISNNLKEQFAWCINVRNNKGAPIEIDILDQIPLSTKKEIVVTLQEKDGAAYDPVPGKLLWRMKIDPNKTRKVEFTYTVEHPAGTVVADR